MTSLQKMLLIPGLEKGHSKSEQQLAVLMKGSKTRSDVTPGGPLSQSNHSWSSTRFCPISQKQTHATKHSWALQVAPNFIHCGEWRLLCETTGFIKINRWIPCTRLSLQPPTVRSWNPCPFSCDTLLVFNSLIMSGHGFLCIDPFWHSLNFLNL